MSGGRHLLQATKIQHAPRDTHRDRFAERRWTIHVRRVRRSFQTKPSWLIFLAFYPEQIHVYTRGSRGFGGKQEMLCEEVCFWRCEDGRPVKWEFTREEEFTAGVSRLQ